MSYDPTRESERARQRELERRLTQLQTSNAGLARTNEQLVGRVLGPVIDGSGPAAPVPLQGASSGTRITSIASSGGENTMPSAPPSQ